MKTISIKNHCWDIAADIHFPPSFDEMKKYPAIISAHPIGSCKEQMSGNVYGTALAQEDFIVIAFDASFQGASGGEPRFIEDPVRRVEDFRVVVDYLMTLSYVDENRIGVLGLCGGGGYSINAAMTERRIKAVGFITGVNYGRLMREGFSAYNPIGALEAMARQRTAEVRGGQERVDNSCQHLSKKGRSAVLPISTCWVPRTITRPPAARSRMAPPERSFRTVLLRWVGTRSISPRCCSPSR